MTLLEAIAAMVILGLSVVAFLTLFDGSASAARRADQSSALVGYAETALNEATLGADGAMGAMPAGMTRRIERRPWRTGLAELVVTVRGAEGDSVQLHRLVRAQ